MLLRLVPGSIVVLLALVLSGCAHFDDRWAQGTTVRGDGDAVAAAADRPTLRGAIGWGRPVVLPVSATSSVPIAEIDGPYFLDTGDKLRVFVYGEPSLSKIYTVDRAGRIAMPLIGSVRAQGMTTSALRRSIAAKLGAQYLRDPQVTVDIVQNRPFFILGEVRRAGQYPYVNGMTARMAVAIGGGFATWADEHRIQITRRTNGLVSRMDVPEDFVISPGDTVYVYQRFF
jgi:polysaccharide export outer membrane protein